MVPETSRRSFLKGLAGSAALLPAAATVLACRSVRVSAMDATRHPFSRYSNLAAASMLQRRKSVTNVL